MVYENRTEPATWCITILCVHPCLFSFFSQLARKGMHQRRGMHRATVESALFGYTCGGVDPQSMMEQMAFPRREKVLQHCINALTHSTYASDPAHSSSASSERGAAVPCLTTPSVVQPPPFSNPKSAPRRGSGPLSIANSVTLFGHFCAPQR